MNQAITSFFTFGDITPANVCTVVILSFVLGLVVGFVYKITHKTEGYSQSFIFTLVMISTLIAIVIMTVGSNVARAFSLGGALSIIRFRMALRDPKDIAYVFFATVAGLAVGAGAYAYAVIGVVLLSAFVLIMTKLNLFAPKATAKKLKIVIPEDLNYEGKFDGVLNKYCEGYTLRKVMNIDLGTLFELVFDINMKNDASEKEMLDEIRALNGNLKISLILNGTEEY
jgi:hypothetical protein